MCCKLGYSVATFTSPHLEDYRERFRFNGENISKKDFMSIYNKIEPKASQVSTEFELLTLLAFLYFEKKQPEFTLLETGLGGRLDTTNVVCPTLSIITSIDLDHQQILGETLTKIANEKAGIIKPSIPIITTSTQYKEVLSQLEKNAHQKKAKLMIVPPIKQFSKKAKMMGGFQKTNCKPRCHSLTSEIKWKRVSSQKKSLNMV